MNIVHEHTLPAEQRRALGAIAENTAVRRKTTWTKFVLFPLTLASFTLLGLTLVWPLLLVTLCLTAVVLVGLLALSRHSRAQSNTSNHTPDEPIRLI